LVSVLDNLLEAVSGHTVRIGESSSQVLRTAPRGADIPSGSVAQARGI
jgi:negative regulator of replication initiation